MTFDKVKEIIVEVLSCDEDAVTLETKIIDDLGADSLDSVELSVEIEDRIGIAVPDEELKNFVTVGDIVAFVDAQ